METPSSEAKKVANNGYQRLLKTFAAVSDDRLNYTPSPTSRTPLQIVAHCGFANQGISKMILGEPMPFASFEEMEAVMKPLIASITTRQQALDLVAESMSSVNTALDAITPEILDKQVAVPSGQMPIGTMIYIFGMHMQNHASQIDYIQTIWGDMVNHI
ncbi:MAG: DinB family protein [Capsulimonadaceae bacterium]|nr:DinB family protein [Capsulimonadaceae bacterium]